MDFDLAIFVRESAKASGVPEKVEDADTLLDVVRLLGLRQDAHSA
jgi:hypothetical protein